MEFIYIANRRVPPNGEMLVSYYTENIVKIANILKINISDIPKGIELYFKEGEDAKEASYNRDKRKIIYEYSKNESVLNNKGRLIHEAAHVVQNYRFNLIVGSVIWCWSEGIADYCRYKLDPEFIIGLNISCDPEGGYKKAASFLCWLSIDYPM